MTADTQKQTIEKTTQDLEQFGADIATMLVMLRWPHEGRLVIIELIPSLYVEQMDVLYNTLYDRCVEQATAEILLSADTDYHRQMDEIDQETAVQLRRVLETLTAD